MSVPVSGLWWLVECEISERGTQVRNSLWALVVLLQPASCPPHLLAPREGKQLGKDTYTHVHM